MNRSDELRTAVVELGCAEIPAAFLPDMMQQLQREVEEGLSRVSLDVREVRTLATPRRLVTLLDGVPPRGQEMSDEVRGPSVDVAYDEDGLPTQAAEGFARSQGVAVEELESRSEEKGEYVYAVHRRPGRAAAEALAEVMEGALSELSPPQTMRWGRGEYAFVRPVRWLLALLGEEVIPLEYAGAVAGRHTRGPRFRPEGAVVPTAGQYLQVLADARVVVDHRERREKIVAQCHERAQEVGGEALLDETLLDEVTYLVEHPAVVRGDIPTEFMNVPRVVVVTAMQEHLRFFPVQDSSGEMSPHFLSVINGTDNMVDSVRGGNELVLHARLADARFFWKDDAETSLARHAEQLEDVLLHRELGTYADKVKRLRTLVRRTAPCGFADGSSNELLDRAAQLCKADLVTQMVTEFPSLQGVMGEEYARVDGEDGRVCRAIGEHYRPTGRGDDLPQTEMGLWLSLLDKVDDLTGGFLASLSASGSEDPYGLRRAAAGIVRVLSVLPGISLRGLLREALNAHGASGGADIEEALEGLTRFLRRRMVRMMRAAGYTQHLTEGILAAGFDDIADVWTRAEHVEDFLQHCGRAEDFLVAWRRCHNLADRGDSDLQLQVEEFTEVETRQLCDEFLRLKPEVEELLDAGRYRDFLRRMASLREPVDAVMDSVMIMDPDEQVRRRRLALLAHIDEMFSRPMDWSRLPG